MSSMTDPVGAWPGPTTALGEEAWSEEWVSRFLRCKRCDASTLRQEPTGVSCRACGYAMGLVGPGLLDDLPEGTAAGADAATPRSCLDEVARRVRAFDE